MLTRARRRQAAEACHRTVSPVPAPAKLFLQVAVPDPLAVTVVGFPTRKKVEPALEVRRAAGGA